MSSAKPRKTSTRGTARKRTDAGGAASTESPIGETPAIDAAAAAVAPIASAAFADVAAIDAPSAESAYDAIEREIRTRAYELYLSRGAADGDDLSDWLEAERIVRNSRLSSDSQATENSSSPPA